MMQKWIAACSLSTLLAGQQLAPAKAAAASGPREESRTIHMLSSAMGLGESPRLEAMNSVLVPLSKRQDVIVRAVPAAVQKLGYLIQEPQMDGARPLKPNQRYLTNTLPVREEDKARVSAAVCSGLICGVQYSVRYSLTQVENYSDFQYFVGAVVKYKGVRSQDWTEVHPAAYEPTLFTRLLLDEIASQVQVEAKKLAGTAARP